VAFAAADFLAGVRAAGAALIADFDALAVEHDRRRLRGRPSARRTLSRSRS
jgi:hypothetical protein